MYEGKRPRGKIGYRDINIKMNLKEIDWHDVNWIHLTQNRKKRHAAVNGLSVMNTGVHKVRGVSLPPAEMSVSQKARRYMELASKIILH
jgi:hypothetical protein